MKSLFRVDRIPGSKIMTLPKIHEELKEITQKSEKLNETIQKLVDKRQNLKADIGKNQKKMETLQKKIATQLKVLQDQGQQLNELSQELHQLQEEHQTLLIKKHQLQKDVKQAELATQMEEDEKFFQELEANLENAQLKRKVTQKNLHHLETEIEETEKKKKTELQPKSPPKSEIEPELENESKESPKAKEINSSDGFDPGLDDPLTTFQDKELTPRKNASASTADLTSFENLPEPLEPYLEAMVELPSEVSAKQVAPQIPKEKFEQLCIICHMPLSAEYNNSTRKMTEGEDLNTILFCPNEHGTHRECLKHWIIHSSKCPVCHEDYSPTILQSFEKYKQDLRKAQQKAEKKRQEEIIAQNQKMADLPEYTAGYDVVKEHLQKREYERAVAQLWHIYDQNLYLDKDAHTLKLIFQIGVTYFKMEKFALALKQFMKLVRIDYEYPLGFYFLGKTYEKMNMSGKMLWAYERSIRNLGNFANINPRYEKFYHEVNLVLQKAQKILE